MRRPITRKEFLQVQRELRVAMRLASSHDPDHAKALAADAIIISKLRAEVTDLKVQMEAVNRRLDRLGAPQYRRVK